MKKKNQPSDGSCSKTWGQVPPEGPDMLWLLLGHEYLCLEESLLQEPLQMKLLLSTFLTRVRVLSFSPRLAFQVRMQSTSSIQNPTPMLPNPVIASSRARPSTGVPSQDQSQLAATPSSGTHVARGASPFRQANDSEELRRATSPPNARCATPWSERPIAPAAPAGKQRRPYTGDEDGEGSTDSVIREACAVTRPSACA
jgi:hypothetical protein